MPWQSSLWDTSAQDDHLKLLRLQVAGGIVKPPWLFLQRCWDCTPVHTSFGALRSVLAPAARYWEKIPKAERKGKSTWRKSFLHNPSVETLPAAGELELCAQTADIAWPEPVSGFWAMQRRRLSFQPVFLSTSTGSSQLSALEALAPCLNLKGLAELCKGTKLVILALCSDLASSCSRAKVAVGDFAEIFNENS